MIKKPNGYWNDWNNVEREMQGEIYKEYRDDNGNVVKKSGEFPTKDQLGDFRRSDLTNAVSKKKYGGLIAVKKKMRFHLENKLPGYWDEWENVERELRIEINKEYRDDVGNVVKKTGEFPTKMQLRDFRRSDLTYAVFKKKYGGINAVRQRMGFDNDRNTYGYWDEWENVERELRIEINREYTNHDGFVVKKSGEFPKYEQLEKFGRSDLTVAFSSKKGHGGINAVRQRMGFDNDRNTYGYWDEWENVERELRIEINREYTNHDGFVVKKSGEFPVYEQLKASGRWDLYNAIQKEKYGGINAVRQAMGYTVIGKIKTPEAFYELIKTEQDARLIVQSFGGDDADVADIMAVVYEGRLTRDDALRFIQEPSLREYLGRFQKPDGIGDLMEGGERLLPYDKNGVIGEIIFRRALEYRSGQLGPNPTAEQRKNFLKELDEQIACLN